MVFMTASKRVCLDYNLAFSAEGNCSLTKIMDEIYNWLTAGWICEFFLEDVLDVSENYWHRYP